ncbi:MAG: hypothetical protein K2J08_11545 [Ruminococcus sp.]|nr:hypothetical protein [Ruminococcus sp.]
MELTELYNKAVQLIEEVKKAVGQTADCSGICVIANNSGKIYAGTDGIKIADGIVSKATPEYNAVISMLADGNTVAGMMINISADGNICPPCSEVIEMLVNANSENVVCEVAVSPDKSLRMCEISTQQSAKSEGVSAENTAETVRHEVPVIADTIEFAKEPISDSMSFEEKFGFDFDDTPSTPVPTLDSDSHSAKIPQQENNISQPVQNVYSQQQQGYTDMSGQFVNMPSYQQPVQTGYPQPQPMYPNQQGYINPAMQGMVGQFIQPNAQFTQSGNQIFTPQPSVPSGQQIYGQPVNQGYPQQPVQPVQSQYSQQMMQSNPYVNSQPVNNAYPQASVSSRYINSGASQSVTLSGEGKSKFRQRLSKFMDNDITAPSVPQKPANEEVLSKSEIRKQARDKKKMAKVNADFKKRMKDLGY